MKPILKETKIYIYYNGRTYGLALASGRTPMIIATPEISYDRSSFWDVPHQTELVYENLFELYLVYQVGTFIRAHVGGNDAFIPFPNRPGSFQQIENNQHP